MGAGELSSVMFDEERIKARVVPIGPAAPHAVLATARSDAFTRRAAEATALTADVLAVLMPAAEAEDAWSDFREASTQMRASIFQLLMCGQVSHARRTAAGIAPDALDEVIHLYLLDCHTASRTETARALETAIHHSPGPPAHKRATPARRPPVLRGALVVPCPAYDQHLIVIAPAGAQEVTRAVRDVVKEQEALEVGISEATDLALTAHAYQNAKHALHLARRRPDGISHYNDRAEVTDVLDEEAYRWAESFLQPLLHAPHVEHDRLFSSLRVGLDNPVAQSAKILDVHRNTVAGRIKRAAQLLRLDLDDIRVRAVLHLALQLDAKQPAARLDSPRHGPANLEAALSRPPVQAWAEATLAPLDTDGRDLRGTLRTWIFHNADATAAAARLDCHAQTVRSQLRSVGQLLDRDLLAGGDGTHDLVLALAAVGETLPLPGSIPPLAPGYLSRILHETTGIDVLPEEGPESTGE